MRVQHILVTSPRFLVSLILVILFVTNGFCETQKSTVSGVDNAPFPKINTNADVSANLVRTTDAGALRILKYPRRKRVIAISSPAILSQADTEYILQNDVVADGTAFSIAADSVTLVVPEIL